VSGGSSGFTRAALQTVPFAPTGAPVLLDPSDQLLLRVSVRRTCAGGGHASGTARPWYNGPGIDSGATRAAGSRFGATIDDTTADYYLRGGLVLSTSAGRSPTWIDRFVGQQGRPAPSARSAPSAPGASRHPEASASGRIWAARRALADPVIAGAISRAPSSTVSQ